MEFMTGVFFVIMAGIASGTLVGIAKAIGGRGGSRKALARLGQQLDQHAEALEDAQASLASQARQIAELQERVDFAERLLAQVRNRSALGAGPDTQE